MNKKELMKMLEQVDDDTEIISIDDNYELKGNYTKASCRIVKMQESQEQFRDDFDCEYYTATVYKPDDNGKDVILIG